VHIVLVTLAPDQASLDEVVRRARRAHDEFPGIDVIWRQDCYQLPTGRTSFGFKDGIGQPSVEGVGTPATNPGEPPIKADEFILGYPDETGVLPPMPTPDVLGRNGTYVVFRKLHTRVAAYRRYLRERAADRREEALLGAKMVGRWQSGRRTWRSRRRARFCRAPRVELGYRRALVRPAMKYDSGAIPAVLTSAVKAHSHFGPRTWLAGRRLRSMSIAVLRAASAAAAAMRIRCCALLGSFRCLAMATPRPCVPATPSSVPVRRWTGRQSGTCSSSRNAPPTALAASPARHRATVARTFGARGPPPMVTTPSLQDRHYRCRIEIVGARTGAMPDGAWICR
jgi:hypothetical protein